MTEDIALTKLGKVLPVLSESWEKAWHDVDVSGRFYDEEHDRRCQSCILQMRAVIYAKELLKNAHGARYHSRQNQHIITIPSIAHVVLKQLSATCLCPKFAPTSHARKFYSQDDLHGLEDLPRLACGPVINHDRTALVGVYLILPKKEGRANNWMLDISYTAASIDNKQLKLEFGYDNAQFGKPKFILKDEPRQKSSTA